MTDSTDDKMNRQLRHMHLQRDDDGIAWLSFDVDESNANILSADVFAELDTVLDSILHQPPTGLVFQSAKKAGFIAGANVKAFTKIDTKEQALAIISTGQLMFNRIEALSLPTVAMIHGYCLGGGFELALACDYRIACEDEDSRLGLPEVLLGIHPGFGGSMRLIRLIGPVAAMPLMLRGRAVDAHKAKSLGIVDEAVPRRHLQCSACQFILNRPQRHQPGLIARLANTHLTRPLLAAYMTSQTRKRVRQEHYPAPFALIDVWRKYGSNEVAMQEGEAQSIARLFSLPTAKRLVRVFLLQERLKGLGSGKSDFAAKHVHVIGAGVMGGDIAAWCAYKGFRVTLQDREPGLLETAMKRAHKLFRRRLKTPYLRQAASDRLIPDQNAYGINHADVVIEAVIEDLNVKTALYREIEPRMKPGALLATNTSSIQLEKLASSLKQPSRLIGLHFFNPVAKMQLVEITHSEITDPKVLEHGIRFVRLIDRLPLPAKSAPGFLVNRVLLPYLLEAVELFTEGVPVAAIDEAAKTFGMPIGPIQLADTIGLDICHSVAHVLASDLGMPLPGLLDQMFEEGALGVKSGKGFYTYKKGKPVIEKHPIPSNISTQEIQDRLMLRMLNECVACLREEIISDAALLDAGMIFGTGFAPFRGGPMHYLEDRGISELRRLLEQYQQRYGDRFRPDHGWEDLHSLIP